MDDEPYPRYPYSSHHVGISMSDNPALDRLLAENGLNAETHLYREVLSKHLKLTGVGGVLELAANPNPSESVVDIYGAGHTVQAAQVGPGLAFAWTPRGGWQDTMELRIQQASERTKEMLSLERMEVVVRLGDILDQGGLVYPVESVAIEKAWYCTLPSGSVNVRPVM